MDAQLNFIGNQPATASLGRQSLPGDPGFKSSKSSRKSAFDAMIAGASSLPVGEKLDAVNRFFNEQIIYQTDEKAWGGKDYWATPSETLAKGAGDCEDFAIAKYYALQQLGVEQSKLRIVYVQSNQFPEPHMVLAYSEKPESDPLILDNIEKLIAPNSSRTDLKTVYSFNETGLYVSGKHATVAGPDRLSKWVAVMNKVSNEAAQQIQASVPESKLVNYPPLNAFAL